MIRASHKLRKGFIISVYSNTAINRRITLHKKFCVHNMLIMNSYSSFFINNMLIPFVWLNMYNLESIIHIWCRSGVAIHIHGSIDMQNMQHINLVQRKYIVFHMHCIFNIPYIHVFYCSVVCTSVRNRTYRFIANEKYAILTINHFINITIHESVLANFPPHVQVAICGTHTLYQNPLNEKKIYL